MKEFHVTFSDLDWGGCDRKPQVAWGGYKDWSNQALLSTMPYN
jgi:hypothetical protein